MTNRRTAHQIATILCLPTTDPLVQEIATCVEPLNADAILLVAIEGRMTLRGERDLTGAQRRVLARARRREADLRQHRAAVAAWQH